MGGVMSLELVTGIVGLAAAVLTAGRVVFVLEERVADLRARIKECESIGREFNGPARNAHTELVGRVSVLERDTAKLATIERVDALGQRMDAGISEIKAILARIEREMDHDGK